MTDNNLQEPDPWQLKHDAEIAQDAYLCELSNELANESEGIELRRTYERLPYPVEDYKKYVYAQGRAYISRVHETIEALGRICEFDEEDLEDLDCMLNNVYGFLWAAAFGTDDKSTTARMAQDMRENQHVSETTDDTDWPIRRAYSTHTYADGRPVTTSVRFGEADDDYVVHVWHPDPDDPGNQPGAVHDVSRPHPYRFGLLKVTAPGEIRVVYGDERSLTTTGRTDDGAD